MSSPCPPYPNIPNSAGRTMTPACSEQHLRNPQNTMHRFPGLSQRTMAQQPETRQHHRLRDAIQAQHPLYDLASGNRKGGGVRICGNVWELRPLIILIGVHPCSAFAALWDQFCSSAQSHFSTLCVDASFESASLVL